MKQKLSLFIVSLSMILGTFLVTAPAVRAVEILPDKQGVCSDETATGAKPDICKDNLSTADDTSNPILGKDGILTTGIKIFTLILGVVTIFVLMINGVRMMTAAGDPNSINSARNGIIYALIGLVIAISAQMLVTFVLNKL